MDDNIQEARRFGGETMRFGEVSERVSMLNGLRVRAYDGESGTVYNVFVNRAARVAQIWVNMDSGGARCFRPHHLDFGDALGPEWQNINARVLAADAAAVEAAKEQQKKTPPG